jgi:hypothetical protein
VGGRAAFATLLPTGSYTVTASYLGNANSAASNSAALAEKVAAASRIILSSSLNPCTQGQTVTFTAIVPNPGATGTVTFYVNNVSMSVVTLDTNGKATFTTHALPLGSVVIRAVYSGDAEFNGSAAALLETVFRALGRTF